MPTRPKGTPGAARGGSRANRLWAARDRTPATARTALYTGRRLSHHPRIDHALWGAYTGEKKNRTSADTEPP